MATTLDQLLYGIRQVESGGNYSVVNGIGAVGAYQVMKANIPSWTKKALGYSMTWQLRTSRWSPRSWACPRPTSTRSRPR